MGYDYFPLIPTFKFTGGRQHATRGTMNIVVDTLLRTYKYMAIASFGEEQVNKTLQEWKEKPRNQATPSIHLSSD